MKSSLVLLLAVLTIAIGCSKDPISVQNVPATKYKLQILPDSLSGVTYTEYNFKSRIDGIALSDIRVEWDFGDGAISKTSGATYHTYTKSGNYTLKAKGYDYFADTLIAENSIPVSMVNPIAKATLYPRSTDTVFSMNEDGTTNGRAMLQLQTPIPIDYNNCQFHITGPSMDTTILGSYGFTLFPFAGTYTIVGIAKNPDGSIYATDTSIFRVLMPPVSLLDLQKMTSLTVQFYVDPKSPFNDSTGFKSPLIVGLPFSTTPPMSSSWNGASFSTTHNAFVQNSTTDYTARFESLQGQLSKDIFSIASLNVTVEDSSATTTSTQFIKKHTHFGYSLRDLQLFSVTNNKVIYAVVEKPQVDFASNLFFKYSCDIQNTYVDPCYVGPVIYVNVLVSNKNKRPNPPYALVIFSK